MGTAKNQTCVECGQPGSLNTHPDCYRARHARHRQARRAAKRAEGVTSAEMMRGTQARKLGLTAETLRRLMSRPCDVCGSEAPESRKSNSAYARKDSGAVTGTVCQRCASGLGFLGHDPARLRAALALLTSENDHRDTSS